MLLYGNSRFDENKNKFILHSSIKYIKTTERWIPFRIKFHQLPNAVINIKQVIYIPFYFLIFTNLIFVFFVVFLLAYFVSPGNSHDCYRGTVECICSYIYFCEHIIIDKKNKLIKQSPKIVLEN